MVQGVIERAWAAGFFDGEGSTSLNRGCYLIVCIGQAHREVLDRFCDAVGVGSVSGPYQQNARWKPMYAYRALNNDAIAALDAIWPWLGTEKRLQAEAAKAQARTVAPTGWCRRGLHDLTQPGARALDGRCRECRNDAKNRRRRVG